MNQDFKEFFSSLNAKRVEFLIVGGVAYNFYAPPRATKDIDVWVHGTLANSEMFLDALTAFGFAHGLQGSDLVRQDRVLMLGRAPNRIDILTAPKGLDWDECWPRRVLSDYAGEPVAFLAIADLLGSKRAAGRAQDLVDAHKLEAIIARQGVTSSA